MERRTVLATAGAVLGGVVAGCLSTTDGQSGDRNPPGDDEQTAPGATDTDDKPTADESPGNSPTDESVTPTKDPDTPRTPVEDVVVDDIVVRKAVTYRSTMGSGGVLAGRDRQYVVATVRADRELPADAFAFETEDDSWKPGLPDTRGARNWAVAGREGGAVGSPLTEGARYLAFTVPSPLSASEPRIRKTTGDGATWPLSAEARERLAAPSPAFELREFDAPESVRHGKSLSVSLTAENVSDTDGRFLAAVYWPTERIADDDESYLIEREVAAGETVTAELNLNTEYTAFESGPIALALDGHVAAERTVELTGVPTDA